MTQTWLSLVSLFQAVLLMSCSGAIVGGLIRLAQVIAGRRMSSRSLARIWLLLQITLLVPFTRLSQLFPGLSALSAKTWSPVFRFTGQPDSAVIVHAFWTANPTAPSAGLVSPLALSSNQVAWLVASLIWLAGLLVLASICLGSYIRIERTIRRQALPAPDGWPPHLRDLADRAGWPHSVQLILLPDCHSPFVIGFFRSRIILPVDLLQQFDPAALDIILTHEFVHLRHGDHWLQQLQCLLLCIHWFNPACWLAFRRQRQDSECYCDESTIRNSNAVSPADYAQILVNAANCQITRTTNQGRLVRSGLLPLASLAEMDLKVRLRRILHRRRTSAIIAGAAALIVVLAGCALLPGLAGTGRQAAAGSPTPAMTLSGPITGEQAAAVVLADVLQKYGKVIVEKDLAQVTWQAEQITFQGRLAWTIKITHLTRTDFPAQISDWGVMYRVDRQTGEILERAYES